MPVVTFGHGITVPVTMMRLVCHGGGPGAGPSCTGMPPHPGRPALACRLQPEMPEPRPRRAAVPGSGSDSDDKHLPVESSAKAEKLAKLTCTDF